MTTNSRDSIIKKLKTAHVPGADPEREAQRKREILRRQDRAQRLLKRGAC